MDAVDDLFEWMCSVIRRVAIMLECEGDSSPILCLMYGLTIQRMEGCVRLTCKHYTTTTARVVKLDLALHSHIFCDIDFGKYSRVS
jgi:hypothetical protein